MAFSVKMQVVDRKITVSVNSFMVGFTIQAGLAQNVISLDTALRLQAEGVAPRGDFRALTRRKYNILGSLQHVGYCKLRLYFPRHYPGDPMGCVIVLFDVVEADGFDSTLGSSFLDQTLGVEHYSVHTLVVFCDETGSLGGKLIPFLFHVKFLSF